MNISNKEKELVIISDEEFSNQFNIHQDEDGCIKPYETYGEDLELVIKANLDPTKSVWTLIDSDAPWGISTVSGFQFCNRIQYYIGDKPVPDNIQCQLEDICEPEPTSL